MEENNKPNIKQKLNEGYILSRVIINVVGKPESQVIQAADLIIHKLKKDENFIVNNIEVSDVKKEDPLFTLFAEIELLTKNIDQIAWFCFDYMPASIEIIEPRELKYKSEQMTNFFNDIQQRIHSLDLALKTMALENKKIKTNGSLLMRNMLFYLTQTPKSPKELSKALGIPEPDLQPIIDNLLNQKRLILEGNKYKWGNLKQQNPR